MPATAGRVRMPANNRMQTSASLNTHGIWQNAIGHAARCRLPLTTPAPPHLTCTRWLGMEVEESHTTTVLRSRRISQFLFIGFCSFVAV